MYDSDGDGVIHRSEIRDVILAAYRLGGHHHGTRASRPIASSIYTDSHCTTTTIYDYSSRACLPTGRVWRPLEIRKDDGVGLATRETVQFHSALFGCAEIPSVVDIGAVYTDGLSLSLPKLIALAVSSLMVAVYVPTVYVVVRVGFISPNSSLHAPLSTFHDELPLTIRAAGQIPS